MHGTGHVMYGRTVGHVTYKIVGQVASVSGQVANVMVSYKL